MLFRSAVLEVEDDGVGFDPAAASRLGRGVSGLASRARELGGTFTAESHPGRSLVRAEYPCPVPSPRA